VPKPRPMIALAWFKEDDWSWWLEIDPNFQPDRAHWLRRSEAQITALEQRGIEVMKVEIDPGAFTAWTKANGKGLGQRDRAAYAAFTAMRGVKAH
jgi:hypothetical protein